MNDNRTELAERPPASMDVRRLTGYRNEDTYFASRYSQGDRAIYSLDLSLAQVAETIPRPDPTTPTPGNRQIDVKHALDFAEYIREKREWIAPALILRAPEGSFQFEKEFGLGDSEFGVLTIPYLARTDLRILDGQHRILGIHLAAEGISRELDEVRQQISAARNDPPKRAPLESRQKTLLAQRQRLAMDRISVQIVLEGDERAYRQMFVDIAENAKGITKTLQSRFDTRKVVNRAMARVIDHPLLNGRIEDQLDRVRTEQQYLAAKHVAEIIRAVAVGLGGRVSRKREEQLDEDDLVQQSWRFLDILVEAFPELKAVAVGEAEPGLLRAGSLLGSATMLRVLAGTYHDLKEPSDAALEPLAEEVIVEFFAALRPHLSVPVTDQLWIRTGIVDQNAHAPRARGGDIRRLAEDIAGWARHGLPAYAGERAPEQDLAALSNDGRGQTISYPS